MWGFKGIPLNFWEADKMGWRAVSQNCTNDDQFYGYRFIPPGDDAIGALYDVNGVLSGFQMMPKRNKVMTPQNPYRFENQPMFQNDSVLGIDVLVLTVYFVDPTIICTTGRTETDLQESGIGNGLWFQNGRSPDALLKVAETRAEAFEEGWRDNTCLNMMGHHSFFGSETWDENQCTDFTPAWVFYDLNEQISGFGFLLSGYDDSPRYQHVQGILLKHMLGNYPSECAPYLADTTGVTLINAYFDDAPEYIVCEVRNDEEVVEEERQY